MLSSFRTVDDPHQALFDELPIATESDGLDGFEEYVSQTNFFKEMETIINQNKERSDDEEIRRSLYKSIKNLPINVDDKAIIFDELDRCFPIPSKKFSDEFGTLTRKIIVDSEISSFMKTHINKKLQQKRWSTKRGVGEFMSALTRKKVSKEEEEKPLEYFIKKEILPFLNQLTKRTEARTVDDWNIIYLLVDQCLSNLDWRIEDMPSSLDKLDNKTRAIVQSVMSMSLMSCGRHQEALEGMQLAKKQVIKCPAASRFEAKMLIEITSLTVKACAGKLSNNEVLPEWFETQPDPPGCISNLLFYRLIGYWPNPWVQDLFDTYSANSVLDDGYISVLCLRLAESADERNDEDAQSSALSSWDEIGYKPSTEDWITAKMTNLRSSFERQ